MDICTPRTQSGERLKFFVSDADSDKIHRGRDWSAWVTDIDTGRRYHLVGAECSLGTHCYCDAVVVGTMEPVRP